jgi:hypothetical protein
MRPARPLHQRLSAATLLISACLPTMAGWTGEISYLEQFSLAADREQALQQLVPGTEEYYYYHCLHLQHQRQYDRVEALVQKWVERFGVTGLVREIRHRQNLLAYDREHRRSLDYLQQELGLRFDHQRQAEDIAADLPLTIPADLLSEEALLKRAMQIHPNLDGLEDRGLHLLLAETVTDEQRRDLLRRLPWPDLPNLPQLVVADLAAPNSGGFGSQPIHAHLMLAQLDECLRLRPELLNEQAFVSLYLAKLRPSEDVNLQDQPLEELAFLERMWSFVSRLNPSHNSLKAHVLHHRLAFDLRRGEHDKQRFLEYLRLPRPMVYVEPKFLARPENQAAMVDLNMDYRPLTTMPPASNDEPLVRAYLQHFLRDASDYREFADLIEDGYLKRLFAEVKIVHGLGDVERWASLLPPAEYQALKDRIDLDFAPTNPVRFGADDSIKLEMFVKNVPTLLVKVYRINAANYYREKNEQVNTSINLDGLVPNEEQTLKYADAPVRRVLRQFEFPSLKQPGVYVIDFIGNGKSSRVLVHKGQLHYVMRVGSAGQMLTVLNEKNEPLADASAWMAGREYKAGKNGEIAIPFSTSPGPTSLMLMHGEQVTLDAFQHLGEAYQLRAGIYANRESLLSRRVAPVVIRGALTLNGQPVSLGSLKDVRLDISSTDLDGITTTTTVPNVTLRDNEDFTHSLRVPPRLRSLTVTLHAKTTSLTTNQDVELAASETFRINDIDASHQIHALQLTRDAGGYLVEVSGKTGELLPNRGVTLTFKHRDFRDVATTTVRSDEKGRVRLGPLTNIEWVQAQLQDGPQQTWPLESPTTSFAGRLHGRVGEALQVPYYDERQPANRQLDRHSVALLEWRGGYVADHFDKLSHEGGLLTLADLPAGDYDLIFKRLGQSMRISIAAGQPTAGYVVGPARKLQLDGRAPLAIDSLQVAGGKVQVQVRNATPATRVHVFAMHFAPTQTPFTSLNQASPGSLLVHPRRDLASLYVQGRLIGDEYRYVLERRYAKKFPGNLLPRPEILLNPWERQEAISVRENLGEGGMFGAEAPMAAAMDAPMNAARQAPAPPSGDFPNLDFLPEASYVAMNLRPDAEGRVVIDRTALHGERILYFVAEDLVSTAQRALVLAEGTFDPLDLRLEDGLDPAQHFALRKQITLYEQDKPFDIANVGSGRFQMYDSLSRVFQFYETLLPGQGLEEFRFLTRWARLSDQEKDDLYSKHACHELHFFLARKDPAFFERVIKPYLANKLDKTFFDDYLLGNDLAKYSQAWNYAQLNVVERILLSQRSDAERAATARELTQQLQLLPVDQDRWNRLFDMALLGQALEAAEAEQLAADKATGDAKRAAGGRRLGLARGAEKAKEKAEDRADLGEAAAPDGEMPQGGAMGGYGGGGEDLAFRGEMDAVSGAPAASAPAEPSRRFAEGRSAAMGDNFSADESLRRESLGRDMLYRPADTTREWAENNYYKLPIQEQAAGLVTINAFWADYARHASGAPFRSTHFAEAARNRSEALLALALLDLPFESPDHPMAMVEQAIRVTPQGPVILFHEQVEAATAADGKPASILVSQNYFRHGDRHQVVDGEQVDKFVTDEFVTQVVYGGQVVVTNPTSARQKLDVLVQIPQGALPVERSRATQSHRLVLEPYRTQALEFYFYFPAAGEFPQFPVHVTQGDTLVAAADPFQFHVVPKPTRVDEKSWDYVSQRGSDEQVLEFLTTQNIHNLPLERIAFRMADPAMYRKTLDVLQGRHVYNHVLWSYSVRHDDAAAVRQYLAHEAGFVQQVGYFLDSPLVHVDPVAYKVYEHLEYRPLVNARAHQLGDKRQILNERFHGQYERWLKRLSYEPQLSHEQQLVTVYYLLLQDRVAEAVERFQPIDPAQLPERLQYDYCHAYLSMSQGDTTQARALAVRHQNHPVKRWRDLFAVLAGQLDEIEGKAPTIVNPQDRNQTQEQLAAQQPTLDLNVDARTVRIQYRNLRQARVRFYLMDIELLFSHNPFVREHQGQFSFIAPNAEQVLELPEGQTSVEVQLPEKLRNQNVLVEVEAAGMRRAQPYYSNDLNVQVMENYGQLQVTDSRSGKPLPGVYCKVYVRQGNGQVLFYKDGYTDLRGRFDYASLSTNLMEGTEKFAILVLSEEAGATVREAAPPAR